MTPAHRRSTYLYETGRSVFKPVAPAKRTPAPVVRSSQDILDSAEADGYRIGVENIHTTPAMYSTGEEWIAWYHGWKRGQAARPKDLL